MARPSGEGDQEPTASWHEDAPTAVAWGAERDTWTRPARRGVPRRVLLLGALGAIALAGVVALQFVNHGPGGALAVAEGGSALGPPPGIEEGARPASLPESPAPAGSSPDYTYLALQPDGRTPVTWSPCRPIHYVVRTQGMPDGGLAMLQAAMADITRHSGLRFVYDGTTTEAAGRNRAIYQPALYRDTWAPVLVSWGAPTTDAGTEEPEVAAWSRPHAVRAPSGSLVFVTGEIDIDATWARAAVAAGDSWEVRAVMLHELGHLVGLEHTVDERLLMDPENSGQRDFADTELPGLASLGAGECHSDV